MSRIEGRAREVSGYAKGEAARLRILDAALAAFGEGGFKGATTRQIAEAAGVNLPALKYYFGGKEGLYAVVVDREIQTLLETMTTSLTARVRSREILEQAALGLLDYIESSSDGFRILVRDSPATGSTGGFASLISDVASQVEYILAGQFTDRGYDAKTDQWVDMFKAGILDPAKVTRSALQNAASIAAIVLTAESAVVEKPEEDEPEAAGHGHMH